MQLMLNLLLAFAFLLAACDPQTGSDSHTGNDIEIQFDRTRQDVVVQVFFYETQGQVDRVFSETFNGQENPGRRGFAVWILQDSPPHRCWIHTLRPKWVDDERMDVLGHEMAHCLYGPFHAE